MRKITHIVVHCSAGSQRQKATDIVHYHRHTLKWKVPGYHYIIEADGTVVNTHPEQQPSNGVKGHNATSLHVCYVGGIDAAGKGVDTRTTFQRDALRRLLRELRGRYPDAAILGHRDLASVDANHNGRIDPWERVKACPCFDAIPEYKDL